MPKKVPSIFLCHSRTDNTLVDLISRSLEQSDFQLWRDETIEAGEDWYEAIQQSLEKAKIFLLIITPESFQSEWAQFEIGAALGRASKSKDVRVIPVILGSAEGKDIPKAIRNLDCLYAQNWNYEELIGRIHKRLLESTGAGGSEDPNTRPEEGEC
jgi:TIR domain